MKFERSDELLSRLQGDTKRERVEIKYISNLKPVIYGCQSEEIANGKIEIVKGSF